MTDAARLAALLDWLKGLEATIRYGLALKQSDRDMIEKAASELTRLSADKDRLLNSNRALTTITADLNRQIDRLSSEVAALRKKYETCVADLEQMTAERNKFDKLVDHWRDRALATASDAAQAQMKGDGE